MAGSDREATAAVKSVLKAVGVRVQTARGQLELSAAQREQQASSKLTTRGRW